jgi:site-specific DNA-methyltransferase (adenine-specific)
MFEIINSDCLEVLKKMPDNSIDSIVTDPPYGLAFMGKKWDYDVPSIEIWQECLRVLKPGGHLLAFAGTRTQHRMAVRIEDAGFEIRDMIMWVYGQGFPKSLDIGKAINKVDGIDEKKWEGFGTSLKPSIEPITVARKPLQGTVAENVLMWGTGGINIDGCRVGTEELKNQQKDFSPVHGNQFGNGSYLPNKNEYKTVKGRFPANLIHDGSEEVVELFPNSKAGKDKNIRGTGGMWSGISNAPCDPQYGDSGSAARFFYQAKASTKERNLGLENLTPKKMDESRKEGNPGGDNPRNRGVNETLNHHPTVKPINLMRYLCRLVTPPGGTVLDPFMGSGSTLIGAHMEGFNSIGIERENDYCEIAKNRINYWASQQNLNL